MEYSFTHRLDLSNPNDDEDKARAREIENKYNWNKIVDYYLNFSDVLAMKYHAGDLELPEEFQVSVRAYHDFLPFLVQSIPIEWDMTCSFYQITPKVREVLMVEERLDKPTHIFHFELVKDHKVLLTSEDWGTTLAFYADENDINVLLRNGVPKNRIISHIQN